MARILGKEDCGIITPHAGRPAQTTDSNSEAVHSQTGTRNIIEQQNILKFAGIRITDKFIIQSYIRRLRRLELN